MTDAELEAILRPRVAQMVRAERAKTASRDAVAMFAESDVQPQPNPRRRQPKVVPTYPDIVHHAAHAFDHPLNDTAALALADHIAEVHGDHPVAQPFLSWVQGGDWPTLGRLISPARTGGYNPAGPYETTAIHDPAALADAPDFELHPHRARGADGLLPGMTAHSIAKRFDTDGWHWRTASGQTGQLRTRRLASARPLSSLEVANHLYNVGGPVELIKTLVGLRHFHPDRVAARPDDAPQRPSFNGSDAFVAWFADPGNPADHYQYPPEHFFPFEAGKVRALPEQQTNWAKPNGARKARPVTVYPQTEYENLYNRSANNEAAGASGGAELPNLDEVTAVAHVGDAARGGYHEMSRTVGDLLRNPEDLHRWVMANAILSAQQDWIGHTAGAFGALGVWHRAGRPTDPESLDRLFGTTRRAGAKNNPNGGAHLWNKDGQFAEIAPSQYTGAKAVALKNLFGQEFVPNVDWGTITKGSFKTGNFGMAFVDNSGVPIDTHMAKLVNPGYTHAELQRIMGGGPATKGERAAVLEGQKKIIENPRVVLAYKNLLAKAAHDLGWPLNQVQEAVWTGAVATMVAMSLDPASQPDTGAVLGRLNRSAIQAGWNLNTVLRSPHVLQHLDTLGVPYARVARAIRAADERTPAGPGPVDTSSGAALESVAQRLPRVAPPAGYPIRSALVGDKRFDTDDEATSDFSDHAGLVHEPDDAAHRRTYARKLIGDGMPAHGAAVLAGDLERLSYWPEELGGHEVGRWYARPKSAGGRPHVHLYTVADSPHAEGEGANHVLHWTVPVASRDAQFRLLATLRREGARRPAHGETRVFADGEAGPAPDRTGPVPRAVPVGRPSLAGAAWRGAKSAIGRAGAAVAKTVKGGLNDLAGDFRQAGEELGVVKPLESGLPDAVQRHYGKTPAQVAEAERLERGKAPPVPRDEADLGLPPKPFPRAAPGRPGAAGAAANPLAPTKPPLKIGAPVVAPPAFEEVPPGQETFDRAAAEQAILSHPGAAASGFKPELLARMSPDAVRRIAEGVGYAAPKPPVAERRQPGQIPPLPPEPQSGSAAVPATGEMPKLPDGRPADWWVDSVPGSPEFKQKWRDHLRNRYAPQAATGQPGASQQTQPGTPGGFVQVPGANIKGGGSAQQPGATGGHEAVVERHQNWIGQQSQQLRQMGIDPAHARGQIRDAMRQLLQSGAAEQQVTFRGQDGKTYTAKLKRKAKPVGSTFSEFAARGSMFSLEVVR